MADDSDKLRGFVRNILEQRNSLSEERVINNDEPFDSKKCTWELFEEFGLSILLEIGYKGDFGVINRVRKDFEADGWNFDEI